MPLMNSLASSVHDVIEALQHRIRYYTNVNDYTSDGGASVGQIYNTSQYKKVITKVEADFDPLVGADWLSGAAGRNQSRTTQSRPR